MMPFVDEKQGCESIERSRPLVGRAWSSQCSGCLKVRCYGFVPNKIYTGAGVNMKYYVEAPALLWPGKGIRDCDLW